MKLPVYESNNYTGNVIACETCGERMEDAGGHICERRSRPRGTGAFNRILDITHTQVRLMEVEGNSKRRKS
jgi:hypothetical protein